MPPSVRRTVVVVVASVLLVFAALVVLAWWQQERITFQPPSPPFDDAGATARVTYAASDGTELFAYLVGPSSGDSGLVLAFHGNADLAVWQIPWAHELAERTGWRVMLAEYRGYGGNSGKPTYANARLDARAALRFANDSLATPAAQMAFFGHSLGSAIATELASEASPAVLLLQSPFTSARDMARIIVARPVAAGFNLISRVHYDTEAKVANLEAPVHVAHGERDLIIPVRMGRRVHAAAKVKGRLLIVPGAGHNNVEDRGGEQYWNWLAAAIAERAR